MPDPVADEIVTVVSGLPRSGTSMMMLILQMGGINALTDSVRQKDSRNPHGYFEFEAVKDKHSYPEWVASARGRAVKVVSRFVTYLPPTEHYRVLFVHRDIEEILRSQRDMASHFSGESIDDTDVDRLKSAYQQHVNHTLSWLDKRPNIEVHQLHYEQLLSEPEQSLNQLRTFMTSQPLCVDSMLKAIDPSLNHTVNA